MLYHFDKALQTFQRPGGQACPQAKHCHAARRPARRRSTATRPAGQACPQAKHCHAARRPSLPAGEALPHRRQATLIRGTSSRTLYKSTLTRLASSAHATVTEAATHVRQHRLEPHGSSMQVNVEPGLQFLNFLL